MRIEFVILVPAALLGVLPGRAAAAQATNPAYLSEMPPVERVLREITGANPDETAARQMGAFLQFKKIIEEMSDGRWARNQLTSDETRLIQVYYTAYWEIAKTKPEYQKFTGLKGFDIDPDYRVQLFERFFSAGFRAEYERIDAGFKQRVAARARADTQNMLRARAEAEEYQRQQQPSQTQRALARCIASGRSETQCLSEGLTKDFKEMFGGILPGGKTSPTGLRLSGVYTVQRGIGITFWDAHAVVACGELVADERAYTVAVRNNQVVIGVRTTPELRELVEGASKPFLITMAPDGRLVGPGATEITGRVIVGVREWTRVYDDGRRVPMSEPVYEWRTVRCNLGAMALTGPSPAIGKVSEGLGVAINLIFGAPDTTPLRPAPTGLRLSGEYGSQAAFDLEFNPRGVVVGCGEAVVAREYTVGLQDGEPVVRVQHGATPFTVTMRPDGALTGTGTQVTVSGRMIVGADDNNLIYAPRSGTCTLGMLPLAGQPGSAAQAAAPAPGGAPAAPAPSGSVAAPLPAGTEGTVTVLAVATGLQTPAGGANPLGQRGFFLLKLSLESALTAAGIRAAPGGSAIAAWRTACERQAPECRAVIQALPNNSAAVLLTGSDGNGQFAPVPAGAYYVVGFAEYNGQLLVWNVKLDLKPGQSTVTLDQRNAVPAN